MTTGSSETEGTQIAIWVCFAIAATGAGFALYTGILGRFSLQTPDLETWEEGDAPAWDSPRFADAIRKPPPVSADRLETWHPRRSEASASRR
jgi:hypothetical protein